MSSGRSYAQRDRALRQPASVMWGAGGVTVLRRVPCPDGPTCGCHYGDQAVLRMSAQAARELARELERCAGYVERDGVL